jgi:Tol biopolymer transport system component
MTTAEFVKSMRFLAAGLVICGASGGCSRLWQLPDDRPLPPRRPAPPPNREPTVQFGYKAAGNANDPGEVNVFGETRGGLKPGPVRTVSEANFQQHTYIDEGYDADVSCDPTGKYIVFDSTRDSEHTNLYMQRTDGTAVIQLTSDTSDDAYPAFSPDGKQIAFASTRAGNWQIFVMDADGKNVTQVTTGPTQAVHPSWSPDGKRLVYASLGSKSQQWELWLYNLETNEKRMIGYGLFPCWAPTHDVERIAFQRPRQRGSRWFSLWTLELVDGEARRVTEVAVSSNAALLSPTWSPDGKRLAFATVMEPNKDLPQHSKGRTDIWTVNADGTERQRLTDGTGTNLMPHWGPDNRVYFISDRGGTECVWSVRAEPGRVFFAQDKKTPPKVQEADTKDPDN